VQGGADGAVGDVVWLRLLSIRKGLDSGLAPAAAGGASRRLGSWMQAPRKSRSFWRLSAMTLPANDWKRAPSAGEALAGESNSILSERKCAARLPESRLLTHAHTLPETAGVFEVSSEQTANGRPVAAGSINVQEMAALFRKGCFNGRQEQAGTNCVRLACVRGLQFLGRGGRALAFARFLVLFITLGQSILYKDRVVHRRRCIPA